ncbi:ABC transporter ATP-binding protein [Bradyrhizobium sp. AUGA SZCCT0182]|uniref:ABC transporter ATP-binding protein n=1 Tax=Bradyrhizobium sp. AUGA SZCCT0182 TaxID=2807667 RepID=UPI001BAD0F8B|nr:ABC transporter ATP-binding protein [Bradyrhizobium sp. AUGA SZCCT0182]MBR1235879.1 ABC transporter ATP-binding protein [Bradyrhizobium sp. AUGA SZCCT0182]
MQNISLKISNLSAGYGETRIIEDINLEFSARQKVAVLGRNGVGKTTLLATLMGLTRRHAGTISLGDLPLMDLDPADRAWAGMGYVPQTRDVFPSLTVEENLRAGLKQRPRAAVEEAYAMFPRLKERRHNPAGRLSGGEQQMLSTARTLLGRPHVLLLDEPLEGLAPVICDELMEAFNRLTTDESPIIIIVEQQIERVLDFVDTAVLLERGRIAWAGSTSELLTKDSLIERYVGVGLRS